MGCLNHLKWPAVSRPTAAASSCSASAGALRRSSWSRPPKKATAASPMWPSVAWPVAPWVNPRGAKPPGKIDDFPPNKMEMMLELMLELMGFL